jgi:hypothetical protein
MPFTTIINFPEQKFATKKLQEKYPETKKRMNIWHGSKASALNCTKWQNPTHPNV